MSKRKFNHKNIRYFVKFALLLCLLFIISDDFNVVAGCQCNVKHCYTTSTCPNSDCPSDPMTYEEITCDQGSCTDSDTCYDFTTGGPVPCSTCKWGYGWDAGNFIYSDYGGCYYADTATTFGYCTASMTCLSDCPSGDSGGNCDYAGTTKYSCEPSNTDQTVLRYWKNVSDHDPDDPNRQDANHQVYADDIRFRSAPSGFCPHWYREEYTGYIWLEGVKELRLVTDDNYAKSPSSGKPGSGECCDGGQNVCGDCEKRGSWSYGCNKDDKNSCLNGHGCQWHVWDKSRCSDDFEDNTGLKIGYRYDSSTDKNYPDGDILNNQGVDDPGFPSGLTTVIESGQSTRLSWQAFAGGYKEFEPGWYPIQAWYTRSNGEKRGTEIWRNDGTVPGINEGADHEYFELQWKEPNWINPSSTWSRVPSTAFIPCGGGGCLSPPGPPTLIAPANRSTIYDTDTINFEWSHSDFGETVCTNRQYTLEVDNNSDFSSPEYIVTGLSESTTTHTADLNTSADSTFYWRVQAINEVGAAWSSVWSFNLDFTPPTGFFNAPPTAVDDGQINLYAGNNYTFSADAADDANALTNMEILVYDTFLAIPPGSDPSNLSTNKSSTACNGATCSLSHSWTPTASDIGKTFAIYLNAYDQNSPETYGRCTGIKIAPCPACAPQTWTGWSDCSTTDYDVITANVVDREPQLTDIKGPSQAPDKDLYLLPNDQTSQETRLYNATYQDPDGNEVINQWSSSCNLVYEDIDDIIIRARGTQGSDGAYPDVEVYKGDVYSPSYYGERVMVGSFTVGGAWQNYTIDMANTPLSSLDVVYTNDDGGLRDLYIDKITYVFTDGSTLDVEAESTAAGSFVYIDRGSGTNAFDGLAYHAAQQAIYWNAAVRFPVPLSFSTVSTSTCDVNATPFDLPHMNTGTTDTLTVNICGAQPAAAANPDPADNETNVSVGKDLSWGALPPGGWGGTCGFQNNSFEVFTRLESGVCPSPDVYPNDPSPSYSQPSCDANHSDTSCITSDDWNEESRYCWYVVSDNGEYYQTSAVWSFETLNLLVFDNWMTTMYGGLYANDIQIEFPDPSDYIAPWNPPHLTYEAETAADDIPDSITLTSSDIDLTTSDSNAGSSYYLESQSPLYAENANFIYGWPPTYKGEPPSNAIEVTSETTCDDMFDAALSPDNTYKASVDCVNDGLANLSGSSYSLASDDIVVLYVTGSGDLVFNDSFTYDDPADEHRIVFVTGSQVRVIFSENLVSDVTNFSNINPVIEAGFIITAGSSGLEFEGVASDPLGGDPIGDPDSSIVVEGPIITKSVELNRNRGEQNEYPSEVVKYNDFYLWKLTTQERHSPHDSNKTGLFVIDVDWISEE